MLLHKQPDDVELFEHTSAQTLVTELGKRPDFIKLMFIEIVEFNGRNMPNILEHVLPRVLPLIRKFDMNKALCSMPPFGFFRTFLDLFFSNYLTELLFSNSLPAMLPGNALNEFVEIFLHGLMVGKESA